MHLRLSTLFLALAVPTTTFAWCPDARLSLEEEFGRSKSAFVGRVVASATVDRGKDSTGGINYQVLVTQRLRGNPTRMTTIFSENSSGRFPLTVGKIYVLFVAPETVEAFPYPVLVVGSCGHSGPLPQSEKVLHEVKHLAKKPAA